MQAPKNGFFYVLDALTGKFIPAQNYVPVNWASHVDPETGRPNVNPEAHYDVTGQETFVMPSAAGGHSWHPMSMSPQTGLVYIPAMYSFWVFGLYDEFEVSPVSSNSAVDYSVHYRMQNSPDLPPEARNEYGGALLALAFGAASSSGRPAPAGLFPNTWARIASRCVSGIRSNAGMRPSPVRVIWAISNGVRRFSMSSSDGKPASGKPARSTPWHAAQWTR
jgi:hypothetical protein